MTNNTEQEPVAWVDLTKEELHQIEMTCETSAECYRVIAKALKDRNYTAPQPVKQKPVAEVVLRNQTVGFGRTEERKDVMFLADVDVGTKLYAKSQQKAEQEPVCYVVQDELGLWWAADKQGKYTDSIPVYAAPVQQSEQKPIGYVIEDNDYEGSKIWAEPINGCCLPVYLAPVHTKDLTDDEIADIRMSIIAYEPVEWGRVFARAVIAADREKNK